MTIPDHEHIALRAVAYADSMCDTVGNPDATFDSRDLAVAYIQGGEYTLHLLCCVITECTRCGHLTNPQANKLLQTIESICQQQPQQPDRFPGQE